jgi:hypothetical protein
VTSGPARPSHARPAAESVPVAVLVALGVIFSFLVTGIAYTPARLVPLTGLLLFVLVAMTPLVVAEASHLLRRLATARRGRGWYRPARSPLAEGARFVLAIAAVGGLITGEIIGARTLTGNDNQRCVNLSTMVVVARSRCEDQGPAAPGLGPGLGASTGWYYGGTGTSVGETAEDGSFSAPGTGSGGGGSGGGGGGEDGGDGGDGGGGDGGGGGGGGGGE